MRNENTRSRDFKDTKIGKIPKEWLIVQQKEVVEFSNGRAYSYKEWEKDGVPVVRLQNLTGTGQEYYYSNLKLPDRQYMDYGDLLFMWSASFGPHIWKGGKAIYHYHIWKVICTEKIDKMFYYYLLLTVTDDIKRKLHGATMLHITKTEMENHKILLPPILEQQAISSILSNVDKIIDQTQQLINHLYLLKKRLMQLLFTQGIGHTEFKDTKIGRIPKEWEFIKLENICKEVYRYPTYYGITYVDAGIPEIRGEMILKSGKITKDETLYRYIDVETSKEFPRTILEEGDIVISVRGTMGKVAIVPNHLEGSNITANLMRISPIRKLIEPNWFIQFLLSYIFQKQLENYSSFTTIRTITSTDLKKIRVPLPTIKEQTKIAQILTDLDFRIEHEQKRKELFYSTKKGLMQDLLTGKKRVPIAHTN